MATLDAETQSLLRAHGIPVDKASNLTDRELIDLVSQKRLENAKRTAVATRGNVDPTRQVVREYDGFTQALSRFKLLDRRTHLLAIYEPYVVDDGELTVANSRGNPLTRAYRAPRPVGLDLADSWMKRVLQRGLFKTRQSAGLYAQMWNFKCWYSVIRLVTGADSRFDPHSRHLDWSHDFELCMRSADLSFELFLPLISVDVWDCIDEDTMYVSQNIQKIFNWLMFYTTTAYGVKDRWFKKLCIGVSQWTGDYSDSLDKRPVLWRCLLRDYLQKIVDSHEQYSEYKYLLNVTRTRDEAVVASYIRRGRPGNTFWTRIYDACDTPGELDTFNPVKWLELHGFTGNDLILLSLRVKK
jgi:hypothetical protein